MGFLTRIVSGNYDRNPRGEPHLSVGILPKIPAGIFAVSSSHISKFVFDKATQSVNKPGYKFLLGE